MLWIRLIKTHFRLWKWARKHTKHRIRDQHKRTHIQVPWTKHSSKQQLSDYFQKYKSDIRGLEL